MFFSCISIKFKRLKHPDFNIAILICAALSSISILFLFCLFGKLSTEKFERMSNCLYDSKWNKLPIELQKFYVIIIGVAQRPLHYHGFGVIYLHLQTFTRVRTCDHWNENENENENVFVNQLFNIFFLLQMIRTVYTWYMMFKTVTN